MARGAVRLCAWLLLFGLVSTSWVQAQSGLGATEDDDAIQVSVAPVYQQFSIEGQTVTEQSLRLFISASLTEQLQAYVQGQAASAGGDELTSVSGLDDTRLGVRYDRSIGEASLRLGLDAALPTGKQELSPEELSTASMISQNYFDFRVPGFGQGTNLFPSASVTIPVADDVVAGLSASYQYLGSYEPRADMTNSYVPGDGVSVTGGLDLRLTATSAVSGDVSFTRYGTDTVGGTDRFEAGNRLAGTLQYLNRFGFNQVRALVQYQERKSSRLFFPQGLTDRSTRVFPRQGLAEASYRTRLTDRLNGTVRLRGLLFRETSRYDGRAAGELTVRPEYELGESVVLGGHLAYTAGGVSALEGGLRVDVGL